MKITKSIKIILCIVLIIMTIFICKISYANSVLPYVRIVPVDQIDFQIILLIIVSFVETIVMILLLKLNCLKLFGVVFLANIFSYLIGFLGVVEQLIPIFGGVIPPFNHSLVLETFKDYFFNSCFNITNVTAFILSYLVAWLIFLVISFIVSTTLEYSIVKYFYSKIEKIIIVKSCIIANITSYLLIFLIIASYYCSFFSLRYNQLAAGIIQVKIDISAEYKKITLISKDNKKVVFSILFESPFQKLIDKLNSNQKLLTQKISNALKDQSVENICRGNQSGELFALIENIVFEVIQKSEITYENDEDLNKFIFEHFKNLKVHIYGLEISN